VIEGIRAIEKGDFEVEVSTSSEDELGRLANAFNSMARQLRRFHELNIDQIMTEKRKSETIIRTIDDGIVVVDPEARVTDLNPRPEIWGGRFSREAFLSFSQRGSVPSSRRCWPREGPPAAGEENTLTVEKARTGAITSC
jgi:PAS domain-containing protein